MLFTQKQFLDHNQGFIDEMVNLKVTGWNTYSKALNAYTFNFYKDQLSAMDKQVQALGENMKEFMNVK
tara:strand:+ start:1014 stop:1217 length:204 start_codon:yes stop_codon:yes gene_type:complete